VPLRDHFRPPIANRHSWEGFHGMWPAMMVQRLNEVLPVDFAAEPRVHLGADFEVDVCTYEDDEAKRAPSVPGEAAGRVATQAPPQPTFVVDTDLAEQYEYEVRIYDASRGRLLVAAIEIVSPANKDRRENRGAFVTKCAALVQQDVCVSIVDLVTTRHFNLYAELLALLDVSDPAFAPTPPPVYAATCRGRKMGHRTRVEAWAHPLAVGQALPTLPVWLSAKLSVSLDLEATYEQTCRLLRIT
jgi:hypothetical protein